jgi:hypothetical protein
MSDPSYRLLLTTTKGKKMKVFAAVDYRDSVLRMFSTLADAEAFVAKVKELDVIHEAWVFSPASHRSDFVAPEGFEGLEEFCGLDIWGVEEFELH